MMGLTPGHMQVPTPSAFHGQQGMVRTPAAPMTPISARTPSGTPHTPGTAHTPGVMTPGSATPGGASTFHTGVPCHSLGVAQTPASSSLLQSNSASAERARQHRGPPRHLVFLTHFPIPNDEQSSHETNQRMMVLYGVGRQRDEARHFAKKVTKEVQKLLGKKNCMDLSGGGDPVLKVKKKKDKDCDLVASLENTFAKFKRLSYHDQHALTQTVAKNLTETISCFAAGTVSYLPVLDNVSFLFDLMEFCLSISFLLELCIQVCNCHRHYLPVKENVFLWCSRRLLVWCLNGGLALIPLNSCKTPIIVLMTREVCWSSDDSGCTTSIRSRVCLHSASHIYYVLLSL